MQLSSTLSLSKPISARQVWNAGIVLLVLVVPLMLPTIADPDLWGHLRFGLDTLNSHSLSQVDPYSYVTTGQRWINHEWLSEVTFAQAYLWAGLAGLNLVRLLVTLALLGINFRYLTARGATVLQGASLLLLSFLLLYLSVIMVRPQLFTFLFAQLVVISLVAAERGQLRWLWFLPLIFVLWPNFHGGFLAGLGILFVWSFLHLIHSRSQLRVIIPVVLLSILATLFNPYGADLLLFLLRTATVPRPDIIEWQPLTIPSVQGMVYLVFVAVGVISLFYSRRPRSIALTTLFGFMALAPLVAWRHLPLFAACTPLLIGEHFGAVWARPFAIITAKRISPRMAGLPLLTALALGMAASGNLVSLRLNKQAIIYPAAAVAELKASGAAGNMVTPFNWGEYTIWHLGPQIQVSMDGRRETIYSDDVYQTQLKFEFGTKNWDALLTQHRTDLVLVDKQAASYNLMRLEPGWVSVYEDSIAAVFAPQGSNLVAEFQQLPRTTLPPDGDGLNFP